MRERETEGFINSETPITRRAVPADAGALAGLSAELGYDASTDEARRRLERIIDSPDHEVLVAVDGSGLVVGWAHVFAAPRIESAGFAELGGLVVAESHRRRGIGRLLIAAAEEVSANLGVVKLRIRSRVEREDAHRFFENLGFENVKKQQVYEKILKETKNRF